MERIRSVTKVFTKYQESLAGEEAVEESSDSQQMASAKGLSSRRQMTGLLKFGPHCGWDSRSSLGAKSI